ARDRDQDRDRPVSRRPADRPAERRADPRGEHGEGRRPLQAARLRLSRLRHLRGPGQHLGLRAARGRAQEQRQAALVADVRPAPAGHGRPRRRNPDASPGLGGLRARRQLQRPARRLPHLQEPIPGRPPDRGEARPARRRQVAGGADGDPGRGEPALPELRQPDADGRPAVQHDVPDDPRAGRGDRHGDLPAAGDRAGDLRPVQEHHGDLAPEAAVRRRPDRQGVPQRDHAGQLHLPPPRVRADGDRVLRAPGGGRRGVRRLARVDAGVAGADRAAGRALPGAGARPGGALPLLLADRRHRVPLPRADGLEGALRAREPHRLRPGPAPGVQRRGPDLLRPADGPALPAARDRADLRRRPDCAHLAARRLRRGADGRRQRQGGHPGSPSPPSPGRPLQGGRAAPDAQAGADRGGAGPLRAARGRDRRPRRLRRDGQHRQAIPPPGRSRHPVLLHGRLRDPRGPGGDGPRPGHHGAASAGPRRGPGVPARQARL
ncbi:MAG: Glycyl-tRNA synthetase, partial [uncultured Thermomicrobiales bacterium]